MAKQVRSLAKRRRLSAKLLAATPPEMLVDPDKHKHLDGLTPEQMAKMEKEMEILQRDLRMVEESHGNEVLNLVLARGNQTAFHHVAGL